MSEQATEPRGRPFHVALVWLGVIGIGLLLYVIVTETLYRNGVRAFKQGKWNECYTTMDDLSWSFHDASVAEHKRKAKARMHEDAGDDLKAQKRYSDACASYAASLNLEKREEVRKKRDGVLLLAEAEEKRLEEQQRLNEAAIRRAEAVEAARAAKEAAREAEREFKRRLSSVLLSGGSRRKATRVLRKHPEWSDDIIQCIAKRQVQIGMTREQAIESCGRPRDINRTVGTFGVHEQWVYGEYGDFYLYFEGGVMTSFQD